MLLTEDQAREKWCPFARGEATYHAPSGDVFMAACGNIFMKDGEEVRTLCIASDCMAWRWQHKPDQPKFGYCGLAGRAT